jgi:hypothetical protein
MHAFFSKIKNPHLRFAALLVYYAVVLAVVVYFQTHGNYATPAFVYQGF